MSLRGYSYRLIQAVDKANPTLVGVRLAKYCINNSVSVSEVAEEFSVSRMTIYSWFTGASQPHPRKAERIEKYLSK
jgi:hypothetical protein